MDLIDLHRQHARHLLALRRSQATVDFYWQGLLPLTRFMAARGVEATSENVTRGLLTEFQLHLRERGLKAGGEHGILRAVRAVFRWALDEELIDSDPTRRLRLPALPQQAPPAVQPDEVVRALAAVKEGSTPLRDKALLLTLYDTGLRASELTQLLVEDIDLVNGVIRVRAETTKKQTSRMAPLGVKAARAITAYERRERRPALPHVQHLFLTAGGEPITRWALTHLLRQVSDRTEIPRDHLAPHAWRRGFAVQYLRNGGGLFTLQQILGHRTLAMTRRYVTYLPDDLQRDHLRASPGDRL